VSADPVDPPFVTLPILTNTQLSVPANVFESSRHRNHGAGTRHDFPSLYPSLTIHTALFSCPKRPDLPHTPPPHSQYIQPHSRKFLSLTSCCLCLWRRPVHLATARSTRILYLWRRLAHLATARTICVATATANFGLWRRPAHLATARTICVAIYLCFLGAGMRWPAHIYLCFLGAGMQWPAHIYLCFLGAGMRWPAHIYLCSLGAGIIRQ
jgi:hypothetical protein